MEEDAAVSGCTVWSLVWLVSETVTAATYETVGLLMDIAQIHPTRKRWGRSWTGSRLLQQHLSSSKSSTNLHANKPTIVRWRPLQNILPALSYLRAEVVAGHELLFILNPNLPRPPLPVPFS